MRILIADDSTIIVGMVEKMLSSENKKKGITDCQIDKAFNREEQIKALETANYDVIVLDHIDNKITRSTFDEAAAFAHNEGKAVVILIGSDWEQDEFVDPNSSTFKPNAIRCAKPFKDVKIPDAYEIALVKVATA